MFHRLLLAASFAAAALPASAAIQIDASEEGAELPAFWQATGWTPAVLNHTPAMRQQIQWLGSLHPEKPTYARIHNMLNLVRVSGIGEDGPVYDWTLLDLAVDPMVEANVPHFFEIMGNPDRHFVNMHDPDAIREWRDFIRQLAEHCIERYGEEEVLRWHFESWNEPVGVFFGVEGWTRETHENLRVGERGRQLDWEEEQWHSNEVAFMNYFDATEAGLRDAHPALRLGGPGHPWNSQRLFPHFIRTVATTPNSVTGEPRDLAFFSLHQKGGRPHVDFPEPDIQRLLDETREAYAFIRENHPSLLALPYANTEMDLMWRWGHELAWRAGPEYASGMSELLVRHWREFHLEHGIDVVLHSADNGFLGGFRQRTLFARFGDNHSFDFVHKPSQHLRYMLAHLGGEELTWTDPHDRFPRFGGFATRHEDGTLAILSYHNRVRIHEEVDGRADFELTGLAEGDWTLVELRLDRTTANPYEAWKAMGEPEEPTLAQLAELRRAAALLPVRQGPVRVGSNGRFEVGTELRSPSTSLMLLVPPGSEAPSAPTALAFAPYTGSNGDAQVLLTWKGDPGVVWQSYEVLHRTDPDAEFQSIAGQTLGGALLLAGETLPRSGEFAVRAVAADGRPGGTSAVLVLP